MYVRLANLLCKVTKHKNMVLRGRQLSSMESKRRQIEVKRFKMINDHLLVHFISLDRSQHVM